MAFEFDIISAQYTANKTILNKEANKMDPDELKEIMTKYKEYIKKEDYDGFITALENEKVPRDKRLYILKFIYETCDIDFIDKVSTKHLESVLPLEERIMLERIKAII